MKNKNTKELKGIILSAGRGSRLKGITKHQPKSFLKVNKGKKLIDYVIENLNHEGIKNVNIITGYLSNKFNIFKKINILFNKKWNSTSIVGSLMIADRILKNNESIVSYADIFYDKIAIKLLKNHNKNNCIVILNNKNWKSHWNKRFKKPLLDVESFKKDRNNFLTEIGLKVKNIDDIQGQYMGIFKIYPKVWKKIRKEILKDKEIFFKYDITKLFNLILIKKICKIYVIDYKEDWFEVDNINDYKILKKTVAK